METTTQIQMDNQTIHIQGLIHVHSKSCMKLTVDGECCALGRRPRQMRAAEDAAHCKMRKTSAKNEPPVTSHAAFD